MKHILFFTIIISIMTSCFTNKGNNKNKSMKNPKVKEVIIDKSFSWDNSKLDYTIEMASLTDSILTIQVKTKGSNVEHNFDLYFNGMYAKSLPTKATLYLKHSTEKDIDDKEVEKILKFDISKAKYYKGDKTIILINSYSGKFILNH